MQSLLVIMLAWIEPARGQFEYDRAQIPLAHCSLSQPASPIVCSVLSPIVLSLALASLDLDQLD